MLHRIGWPLLLVVAGCAGEAGAPGDARPPDTTPARDGAATDAAAEGGPAGPDGGGGSDAGARDGAADARADAADAGPSPVVPGPVNAMLTPGGTLVALHDVSDTGYPPGKVAFVLEPGATLSALAPDASTLWSLETDARELTGGFDLDADGWPDLALVHAAAVASCNADVVSDRFLELRSGRTGAVLATWMTARDLCWTFPSTAYATTQWSVLGVLFGAGTRFLALQRQYETQGFFVAWDAALAALSPQHAYVFPSTSQYGSYAAALPNAYGGTAWVDDAHVANGLVVARDGEEHVVFFTSARLVEYRAAPYGALQLVRDRPFVARADLAGRNYGLVTLDPAAPAHLALLAGTDLATVLSDRRAGARGSDPWGAIERHVTLYDLDGGGLTQRFFSYAHDGGDAQQYEGRVVYPAGPWVRRGAGLPSRLAWNVFAGGRWHLHVSRPASTEDAVVLDDVLLWDVRDLDGDGTDEWLLSPAEGAGDRYLPAWRTRLARWDEAALAPAVETEHDGLPELVATFRRGDASTSRGALQVAPVVRDTDGAPALVLLQADGSRARVR